MKKTRTFKDWSDAGYKINKGSKSIGRDEDGNCLFSLDQVTPMFSNCKLSEGFVIECTDKANAKGTPYGVVEDFDSFVREASLLPDLNRRTVFAVRDPLELHFMNVADKHGVIDAILSGYEEDYY